MSKENLNKKFEEEFNKLSEKDKKEVNNLIRFMHEKKYRDSQYEELLNQYIELSRDYEKSQNIIKEVREKLNTQLAFTSSYQLNYQSAMSIIEEAKSILDKEKK